MKALILVGGFGTRLRPLTLTTPKPLVPFANKAMLARQIEALASAGIDTIVLAVNYQPGMMEAQAKEFERLYKVDVKFSVEKTPLGTAGPIGLAKKDLRDGEPIIVMNSDVICKFPLRKIIDYHKSKKSICTIATVKVEQPENYGVIVTDEDNRIQEFVEKPKKYISNKINAGIYILDQVILDMIDPVYTSIEIDIFPMLLDKHKVYSYDLDGFWMDVGRPTDYLKGTKLYLQHLASDDQIEQRTEETKDTWFSNTEPTSIYNEKLSAGPNIKGNVMIHPTAKIGDNCMIGPDVVIGPNVKIGDGVLLINSVIFEGAFVDSFSFIKSSIIGWNSNIGKWAHLDRMTVLGCDVTLQEGVYISGAIVLPNKSINNDILSPTIIM